ncbi:MAG: hypothetical protein OER88_14375, partial [Planctomycetota bacterium]|nr:hypothetical protein [Planctomycetota bacterium]
CSYNARSLRAHLVLYKQENGRLPDTIEEIVNKHMDKGTLKCPGTGKRYTYLGPKGKGRIILHGFPNGPNGRVTILTREFVTQRVTPAQLEKMLAR